MKVLIACEESGTVTSAFRLKGHEAFSCDILPTRGNPEWHLLGDVFQYINMGWDLMIAHPPCTALTVSGAWYYKDKPELTLEAYEFVIALANAPIDRICIENPVGRLSTMWRKPDQYVQPWMFGHRETKKTGLWLKNLPLLQPTNIVEGPYEARILSMTPSPERARERSVTYTGIAQSMADQWG